jgi:hypothetical protein
MKNFTNLNYSKKRILEHEILKLMYEKGLLTVKSHGSFSNGHYPLYKKIYENASFHFGTLVDILNNPNKYHQNNIEREKINSLQQKIVPIEEVVINDFEWSEVSDAIELLHYNNHILDNVIGDFLDLNSRRISLTKEGAFAFRNGYYLMEAQKKNSIEKQYKIQALELWQKNYWYMIEISKYIMGGVLGSLITLLISRYFK